MGSVIVNATVSPQTKDRARLARLEADAMRMQASGEYWFVAIVARDTSPRLRVIVRLQSITDMFADAQAVLLSAGALA